MATAEAHGALSTTNQLSNAVDDLQKFVDRGRSSLASVELIKLNVPLIHAKEAAHGTQQERQSILLRLENNEGLVGYGECVALAAPTYTSEWRDGAWLVLKDWLVPNLFQPTGTGEVVVRGHPMASAAVEMALLDIYLKQEQSSLAKFLGVTTKSVLSRAVVGDGVVAPSDKKLSNSRLDALVATVADRLASGHRAIKIKISPQWAVEPIRALRSMWPSLDLAVDANGSFAHRPEDLAELDNLGLAYIEQPLGPSQLDAHLEWQGRLATPIALDESVGSVEMLKRALEMGLLGPMNIKPGRLGGLTSTLASHQFLQEHETPGFCGGMYELGLARAMALVVAGLPALAAQACDLGPTREYFERDIADVFHLEWDGKIRLPQIVGIGNTVHESVFTRFEIERARFTADGSFVALPTAMPTRWL